MRCLSATMLACDVLHIIPDLVRTSKEQTITPTLMYRVKRAIFISITDRSNLRDEEYHDCRDALMADYNNYLGHNIFRQIRAETFPE